MKRWISRLAVFAFVVSMLTTGASALSCREVCGELARGLSAGCQETLRQMLADSPCLSLFRMMCLGELPQVPAPDEETPAPDEETPAPDEETPAPDEERPAPDEETPAPDEGTPAPDKETPAPDEERPAPDKETPAPDEETPAPDEERPAPDEERPAPDEETPAPDEETPAPDEGTSAPDKEQTTGGVISAYEAEVIRLVNEIRRQNGLGELTASAELSHVARLKSQDMHDKGYFDHTSPTYGSAFDMLRSFGISYRTAGENIAYGYSAPQAVVDAWMNSSGHRANILNASYTQIGVGHVQDGNYCTQIFVG